MNIETLFNHFHQNHELLLTEAEIFEIIEIVQSLTRKTAKKRTNFKVPELSEVRVYMEAKNIVDAEKHSVKFWNHYEANGWVIGKFQTPMKNWKSAIATWDLPTGKNFIKAATSSVFKNVGKNTENWMGK